MCSACPSLAPAMASGSSSPTCAPASALRLLAGAGERERVGSWPSASSSATEKAALDDRPAPTGSVLVTRTAPPDGRRLQPEEPGPARRALRRPPAAVPPVKGDLERLVGELVRVDADEEAARLRGEGDLGGQVDGHRQREAAVVVGVVADDGDSSGCAGRGHVPSLSHGSGPALTGGLTARLPGHDPAMAERSGPLSGIKIIELAGIGPAPFTCMMLADAGAQVLRLERAAPGAVERGGGVRASRGRARTGTCSTAPGPRSGSTSRTPTPSSSCSTWSSRPTG